MWFGLAIFSLKLGATENQTGHKTKIELYWEIVVKKCEFLYSISILYPNFCSISILMILSVNIVNFAGLGTFTQLGLYPELNKCPQRSPSLRTD